MTKKTAGQTGADQGQSVTATVVTQVKKLRRRRELSAAALAERCAQLGAPEITEHVVRNIEIGRRTISVDQLAVLALALDVAPTHLLSPTRGRNDEDGAAAVRVTVDVLAEPSAYTQWVRGAAPLPHGDEQAFWAYVLETTDNAKDRQALTAYTRRKVNDTSARLVQQLQADAAEQVAAAHRQTLVLLDRLEAAVRDGHDPGRLLDAIQAARHQATSALSI